MSNGWCDHITGYFRPTQYSGGGAKHCYREATKRVGDKEFCTFHANKFAVPEVTTNIEDGEPDERA